MTRNIILKRYTKLSCPYFKSRIYKNEKLFVMVNIRLQNIETMSIRN